MLKSGDKLAFTTLVRMPSGVTYHAGDVLELLEPTGQAPFGYKSKICNWLVKCPHFSPPSPEAVWSSIWWAVEAGILKRI